jgi:Ca-activated chloride channel homolog
VTELSFGYPILLGLAAIVGGLAAWALSRERHRRRAMLAAFGEEPLFAGTSVLPPGRARMAGRTLQIGAITFALLALARPQLGERPASLPHTGRDVLVLLDLSRSMNAVDDSLSRLIVAKQAIHRVLAAVPEDRAGLIVFGGSAFLQLPLNGNHEAFRRFLDAATTDDLGDPATNLGSAFSAAATAFEHEGEHGYRSVVVVSDGESVGGDPGPALARLKSAGIPVFGIGVGSPDGAPVPADSSEAPEKWHRDHIGRVVISRLDEVDLTRAARETGGGYVRATPAGLQSLSAALARMEKRTVSSRESTERIDRFQWPLALAFLALMLAPATALLGRSKQ